MNSFVIFAVLLLASGLCVDARPGHGHGDYHEYGFGGGRGGGGSRQSYKEETNRRIVLKFYQELFGDHDLSAIDRYIDEKTYIQHNPTVADGREPFRAAAAGWFAGVPKTTVDIRRSAAEGDLVWLHVKDNNQAVIDIFRLDCGKIVEHWDVIQEIPTTAANNHPMF